MSASSHNRSQLFIPSHTRSPINSPAQHKSLNVYMKETIDVCRQKKWDKLSLETIWMFLTEEMGELASALRRTTVNQFTDRKKTNVESELMDVLSYLFQIAAILNIDMDEIWESEVRHIRTKRKPKAESKFPNTRFSASDPEEYARI